MSSAAAPPLRQARRRTGRARAWTLGFAALALAGAVVGAGAGAFEIPLAQVLGGLVEPLGLAGPLAPGARAGAVLWSLRLPRVALSLVVGAGLSVAGLLLQALFRNPLASPQVIGVSSGAALGAGAAIVLGGAATLGQTPVALPLAAFAGALATAAFVLRLGRRGGRSSVASLLLAGIVANSLCGAILGLLFFVADDAQLRSLTFWTLGSLGGATWPVVGLVGLAVAALVAGAQGLARWLDLLQLGEEEALLLGVPVARLERGVVALASLAVGAMVAFTGVIGFLGLVLPHLARLLLGPGHRALVPGTAALGAAVLVWADLLCRTALAPAELPIGILTTLLATPFFLLLLHRGGGRP